MDDSVSVQGSAAKRSMPFAVTALTGRGFQICLDMDMSAPDLPANSVALGIS
jgi:hypothetical protein